MLTNNRVYSLLCLLMLAAGCGKKYIDQGPMTPAESMQAMALSEDFRVELFAAEPHVVDPVDMAWDEKGNIYVAEMLDYPDDPPAGKPVRSRIRMLRDTNGDGVIDTSHMFAEPLLQVSGLAVWRGGIIAGAAPDILYLKDTNGDGKADVREVLYTGFPKVNPEGRITNFKLGIDNKFYAANNGADARVTRPGVSGEPLLLRGADMKIDPLTWKAERASGPAQFGLTFDEWGNRFITQNTVHLRHVTVPAEYLNRSLFLEVGAVAFDISPDGKGQTPMFPLTGPQKWRRERTALRQERYKETNPNRVEHLAGYFTAASGSMVYTGDAWPVKYRGSIFTGDVSGNLVRRETLERAGVTFVAKAAKEGVEFLASKDVWFRPAHFANAPDGNLYVLDMYREFIETPESIPEEIKKGMDFWSGDDKGRIYRLAWKDAAAKWRLDVRLDQASSAELVNTLEHANGWHRQTAQRLLVERGAKGVKKELETVLESSKGAVARLHALWTLDGIGLLEPAHVLRAMGDGSGPVREAGLKLAERFGVADAAVRGKMLGMVSDGDVRVRYQAAYSLGALEGSAALGGLAELIVKEGGDRWFRVAVLTSVAARPLPFVNAMAARGYGWENADFAGGLGQVVGARGMKQEIDAYLGAAGRRGAALAGVARGMKMAGVRGISSAVAERVIGEALRSGDEERERAAYAAMRHFALPGLYARALADAGNAGLDEKKRTAAVRALGGAEPGAAMGVIGKILKESATAGMQAAAVSALGELGTAQAGEMILASWPGLVAEARVRAVGAMVGRREWTGRLLGAIESGAIPASGVDIAARVRLLESTEPGVAERAKRMFAAAGAERAKTVAAYQDVVGMAGDARRGKAVFERECARCHLPRRQGGRVGPDLSGVNNKSRAELLEAILNPSAAMEPRFVNYVVTGANGEVFDGVIASETPAAITLRGGTEEGDQTILRKNVREIRASKISLMPEGFEESIKKQEMADLIAYLRAGL